MNFDSRFPRSMRLWGTNELEDIVAHCEGRRVAGGKAEPYLYHDLTFRRLASPRHLALHQDQRRLRPPLHVLSYSAVPRRFPKPELRVRRS